MTLLEEMREVLKLESDDSTKDVQILNALNGSKDFIESYTGQVFFYRGISHIDTLTADNTSYLLPFTQNVNITTVQEVSGGLLVPITFTLFIRSTLYYVNAEFYADKTYRFNLTAGYTDENIPGEIKQMVIEIAQMFFAISNDGRPGVTTNTQDIGGSKSLFIYDNALMPYEKRLNKYRRITF